MSYEDVLVPMDGSDHAARATDHALSLASRFDADVHALAVVDLAKAAGPFDAGGLEKEFVERLNEQAREDLEHVENKWAQPDRYHGEVRQGAPGETIVEYVREEGIDLVTMGTHGRTGVRRVVLGSVAEHVLRKSPVPVLTTGAKSEEPPTLPYEDVLIPTDGSDCASAAVDHALEIAEVCEARVHTLNVIEEAVVTATPGGGLPSEYLESLEAAGEEAMDEIVQRAEERGLDTETTIVQDRPGEGITGYAEANGVDLVVMGTHGRSGLERIMLGSTAEHVVRHGAFPVLSVPGEKD